MAITDYGAVSSQIGGGTVGKNSMRNFNSEMDMSRNGLAAYAKRKANAFQNEALRETAKYGQAPASGGNWASGVGQALSGLKGLAGAFGGNNNNGGGMGTSSQWFDGGGPWGSYGNAPSGLNTSFDVGSGFNAGGFDAGGGIFSASAMDSIVSPDFGFEGGLGIGGFF